MDELKPCPFCKSALLGIIGYHSDLFYVKCTDCFGEGPARQGRSGAIEAWNTRPGEDAARHALDTVLADVRATGYSIEWSEEAGRYVSRNTRAEAAEAELAECRRELDKALAREAHLMELVRKVQP